MAKKKRFLGEKKFKKSINKTVEILHQHIDETNVKQFPPDHILAQEIGLKIPLPENAVMKLSIPEGTGNTVMIWASMPWLAVKYLNLVNIPCGWYEWNEQYVYIYVDDFVKSIRFLFEEVGFKPKEWLDHISIDIP